jgi:hypothetical protein
MIPCLIWCTILATDTNLRHTSPASPPLQEHGLKFVETVDRRANDFALTTTPGSLTVAVTFGKSGGTASAQEEHPSDKVLLAVNGTFVLGMAIDEINVLLSDVEDGEPTVQLTVAPREKLNAAMSSAVSSNTRGGSGGAPRAPPEESLRGDTTFDISTNEPIARRAAPPMYDWRLVGKSER